MHSEGPQNRPISLVFALAPGYARGTMLNLETLLRERAVLGRAALRDLDVEIVLVDAPNWGLWGLLVQTDNRQLLVIDHDVETCPGGQQYLLGVADALRREAVLTAVGN